MKKMQMIAGTASAIVLALTGCSPKVKVVESGVTGVYPALAKHESFALIEDKSEIEIRDVYLGDIEIKDSGFSLTCDYETVKAKGEFAARQMGGNCLVITEHIEPDFKSTCHRIKGRVYRISNPEMYEREILWSRERKLKLSDFKGKTLNRPFAAATFSGFRYNIASKPMSRKFDVSVQTIFDCHMSYFKPTTDIAEVLRHEQLHFDISELYARKFLEALETEVITSDELLSRHDKIYQRVWREAQLKQDEYDTEVYNNRALQEKWYKWVADELEKSDHLREKSTTLDFRQ